MLITGPCVQISLALMSIEKSGKEEHILTKQNFSLGNLCIYVTL